MNESQLLYGTGRLALIWLLVFITLSLLAWGIREAFKWGASEEKVRPAFPKWPWLWSLGAATACYFLATYGAAYTPKNTVTGTVTPSSRFDKEVPFQPVTNAVRPWSEVRATNRAQNAESRAAFTNLPPSLPPSTRE